MSRQTFEAGNVNFKANSKRRYSILDDPERVKRDLENERRITRLQQVRQKSNNLARKIREEVAEEQARQLQNLEQKKQEELNTWRQHVLVKKHHDYRSAVFQVGAAHRAAQAENDSNALKKKEREQKMKDVHRQSVRRICKQTRPQVQLYRQTAGKDYNVEGRVTTFTQTPEPLADDKENRIGAGEFPIQTCNINECKDTNASVSNKRKRRVCCREHPNCMCETSDGEWLSDTSTSSFNLDETDDSTPVPATGSSKRNLQKTPAVIHDMDTQSEDSLTGGSRGAVNINDKFIQTNRKFSNVIRSSSESSPERQIRRDGIEKNDRRVVRSSPKSSPERNAMRSSSGKNDRRSSPNKSPQRQGKSDQGVTKNDRIAKPRFTQISDFVKRSSQQAISGNVQEAQPSSEKTTPRSRSQSSHSSPRKTTSSLPAAVTTLDKTRASPSSPKKNVATSISKIPPKRSSLRAITQPKVIDAGLKLHSVPVPPAATVSATQPMPTTRNLQNDIAASTVTNPRRSSTTQSALSTTTVVLRQGHNTTQNTASARVQFYDYKNKYHRNYDAPAESVHINELDSSQLTAMDHARIENQLKELREQEIDKLRKISDQRGQKALEREQVRRDCAELTEKLEALTQQNPQFLSSDANFIPSHKFADKTERREEKMNEAMEQMLLRPAIVTCPEVKIYSTVGESSKSKKYGGVPEAINVGDNRKRSDDAVTVSSESCCSILLDYVDDQSKQLRNELRTTNQNTVKSEKLKNLLTRIDKIRTNLLKELKAGSSRDVNRDNAQQVIDSIRMERQNILDNKERTLDARESQLQQKEALLEQKLKQFYNEQQKASSEDGKKSKYLMREKESDKPVEIIIKVRSDGIVKQYIPKHKGRPTAAPKLSNRILSSSATVEPSPLAENSENLENNSQRQSSYDSNSTGYRSLPPVIYKGIHMSQQTQQENKPGNSLDPVIANYITRLLSMSRNSIQELGVSSSSIETPASSIVNHPQNRSSVSSVDETLVDQHHMERVQAFIADNRTFIDELENTLRNQSKQNTENSLRTLDDIWEKRLEAATSNSEKTKAPKKPFEKPIPRASSRVTSFTDAASARGSSIKSDGRASTGRRFVTIVPDPVSSTTTPHILDSPSTHKTKQMQVAAPSGITTATVPEKQKSKQSSQRQVAQPSTTSTASGQLGIPDAARQMEHYANLTENCTQRIAELTELINKVREEKQRLVEVTLTSGSDGERHSTEYFELPPVAEAQIRSRTVSERSDTQYTNNTTPSISDALPLSDHQEPLQKHKPTGASRDSGISVSRPLTGLGQALDAEPTSLASSTHSSKRGRVPPATIRRYSPYMVEDEIAHELSTIAEVDTPAQSHIMGATTSIMGASELVSCATLHRREPLPFPSFEEYAQELKLNLSQIHPDQSFKLQYEFNELVHAIHQRRGDNNMSYREFPSINAYLTNMTSTHLHIEAQNAAETSPTMVRDLIQKLRLANVTIHAFPTRRDYVQQRLIQMPPEERDLIDSVSLENLSDGQTHDSSDSFNVEEELRQRRILKSSFQRGNATDQGMASSTLRESAVPNENAVPNESGIDKLSTSTGETLSSDLDREMQRLGQKIGDPSVFSARSGQEASQIGLNLREFLTRELLKHRVHTDRFIDSSNDSLKSIFLKSVIDSLTPTSTPNTGALHGTGATTDKQKTSTPVGSIRSNQEKSIFQSTGSEDAGSHMFSGESGLSSVHYPDGTPPAKRHLSKPTNKEKTPTSRSKSASPPKSSGSLKK